MDTQYLREFVALAETCSFQETAEEMYISASSLSKHIMKMEEELGVPLFDRTTRSVGLTKYGVAFLDYARQIVQLCDESTIALNDIQRSDVNRLSIGFLAMLGQYGIIEMLSDFSQRHSHISLNMVESNEPKELLHSNRCDFVFDVDDGHTESDIRHLLYTVDRLVAVLPLDHPLAAQDHVTIEHLRNEDFIMHGEAPGKSSMVTRKLRELCLAAGFKPHVTMTVTFTSTMVKLVNQGKGIAVMSRMHVPTSANASIAIVDIYPHVPFYIYVLYLKNHEATAAATDFLQYIQARERQ